MPSSSRVKNSHVLVLNAELLQRHQAAITRVMAISLLRGDASREIKRNCAREKNGHKTATRRMVAPGVYETLGTRHPRAHRGNNFADEGLEQVTRHSRVRLLLLRLRVEEAD
jgi:hypothetical protein